MARHRGSFERGRALERLATEPFDVLVVGGGITGAGVVLDAASRGLRAALVERDDFASGTSSKSSKMVHGGIRYLQQGDIRLVYEALAERQRLRKNAPHLVSILPFLLPIQGKGGVVPRKLARALGWAMWMYDLTGGLRIGRLHERLDADEVLAHMDTLPAERIVGGYLYYDAEADDARLTLAIARTAALGFGAAVANRVGVAGFDKDPDGRITGARAVADGAEIEIAASVVVNATGVWTDEVRTLDEGADPEALRPAKGVHVTVPWSLVRNDIAVVVPVPGDKRTVFVVPWGDLTYIGTTDTDYDGPLDDPQCTPEDVAYLLGAVNASSTNEITPADVVGTWAGLRPLVRGEGDERTADLSRQHRVTTSESGLVTITGGKLTTYRRMADDTVDAVVGMLDGRARRRAGRSRTKRLRLVGADGHEGLTETLAGHAHLDGGAIAHLVDRYGTEARVLVAMVDQDRSLADPLVEGLPYLRAEAVYAARYEMARTVDDVLSRRTRARLLAAEASAAAADDVAALIAGDLGSDEDDLRSQVSAYRAAVDAERAAADLPAGAPAMAAAPAS